MDTQPPNTITESDGARVCDHYPSDPCTPECTPGLSQASPAVADLIRERFAPDSVPAAGQVSPGHRAAMRALFELQQWILNHPEMPAPTYVSMIIRVPAGDLAGMAAAVGAEPYGPDNAKQYNVPFPAVVDGVARSITVAAKRKDHPL
jgi:hypothetical protein